MTPLRQRLFPLLFCLAGQLPPVAAQVTSAPASAPSLRLVPSDDPILGRISRGSLPVFEDRAARRGRKIELNILVLHAHSEEPRADPVFYLAGGPGGAATESALGYRNSWMRAERDLVFVDQRGTGKSNALRVELPGSADDPQVYLDSMFQEEVFRAALIRLAKIADLTKYTTPIAMDDLDDVRAALGYERINLIGGSYGTRAILVYLRQHSDRARCAILNGVAPISFLNPLHHARSAQDAFDALCAEAKGDPNLGGAYDHLGEELRAVVERLEKQPAQVTIRDSKTHEDVTVRLTRDAFAETLRVLLYSVANDRKVPRLVHQAFLGDYRPFAETGIESNRQIRNLLCYGMLMCVVGSEDIPRIPEGAIAGETSGTFLGAGRIAPQLAIAKFWPRGEVPADYGEPVHVATPVLLFSGTLDPVTPPRFGAEASSHLENSLHLVVPGAHDARDDPRLVAIQKAFLESASVQGLDVSKVAKIRLPRFEPPAVPASAGPGQRR